MFGSGNGKGPAVAENRPVSERCLDYRCHYSIRGSLVLDYRTWVFDCDGVLLDSNSVKTTAFYRAAEPYGEDSAATLVAYHMANGGISRYVKFQHFLTDIVGQDRVEPEELEVLLETYASHVREGLLKCQVAPRLDELRRLTQGAGWMVVSGGDQEELRWVFAKRGLDELFDLGIFGSPDTKDEILSRSINGGLIQTPGVFVGDSRYDIEAASRAGLDFIFVRAWSESTFDFSSARYQLESISDIVDQLAQQ